MAAEYYLRRRRDGDRINDEQVHSTMVGNLPKDLPSDCLWMEKNQTIPW